jgi:hypothetical protein
MPAAIVYYIGVGRISMRIVVQVVVGDIWRFSYIRGRRRVISSTGIITITKIGVVGAYPPICSIRFIGDSYSNCDSLAEERIAIIHASRTRHSSSNRVLARRRASGWWRAVNMRAHFTVGNPQLDTVSCANIIPRGPPEGLQLPPAPV